MLTKAEMNPDNKRGLEKQTSTFSILHIIPYIREPELFQKGTLYSSLGKILKATSL